MQRFRRLLARWTGVIALIVLLSVFSFFGSAVLAQQPVFTPDVDIDQAVLLKGEYTLRKVLESGEQFFTQPYIPEDAHGEGPDGPRALQRKALYPSHPNWFARLNGLDSQSCFECHNTIGSYREPGTVSLATSRKPGVTGGAAGVASTLFNNPTYPLPKQILLRNPPHVFGAGYSQELAQEMSYELLLQGLQACRQARIIGEPQTQSLSAKGLDFGMVQVTYTPTDDPTEPQCTNKMIGPHRVAKDLIVRPFQWKGIASSVRTFVVSAYDFHFSLQTDEQYGDEDCDKDGRIQEVSVGNVTALSSFVGMTRPPVQAIPEGQEAIVAHGEALFENTCATCHIPSLTVTSPTFVVPPPASNIKQATEVNESECIPPGGPIPGLGELDFLKEDLPVYQQFQQDLARLRQNLRSGMTIEAAVNAVLSSENTVLNAAEANPIAAPLNGEYIIDLSPAIADDLPAYVYPRLPENPDGTIDVPLFSDLRTHKMGKALADVVHQGTDVVDVYVPKQAFLTRPLWGVGDTIPYLHDGRARTLKEAILMHANLDDPNDGSEAAEAVEAFVAMSDDDQDAIVAFLSTLRLPIEPALKIYNGIPPVDAEAAIKEAFKQTKTSESDEGNFMQTFLQKLLGS